MNISKLHAYIWRFTDIS